MLTVGDVKLARSRVVEDERSPVWNEEFRVDVCCAETEILLKVRKAYKASYILSC